MKHFIVALKATLFTIVTSVICLLPLSIAFLLNAGILIAVISFALGFILMLTFISWTAENIEIG